MRLALYVSPLPPPAGGIATWTRILVGRGLPRGWRVAVVDTSAGPERSVFQRGSLAAEIRRAARVLCSFSHSLRSERPSVVHVNVDALALGFMRDAICALLARCRHVPVVIHYHGLLTPLRARSRVWQFLVRSVARRADLNLVLNRESYHVLEAYGVRSIAQVPNFYNERTMPAPTLEERREGTRLQVVFVGGLTVAKGAVEILDLARLTPEADFHLLGKRYPELEGALATAPANVHAHGEVSHAAVVEQLSRSHVFAFPSRTEGFPNVVCEAMAMALPVIATPAGAIPEMVEDGRGGWILPCDPEAFANALRRLLEDDRLRISMGRYNADKARREYAYEQVSARLCELYEGCLRSSVPPPETGPRRMSLPPEEGEGMRRNQ